MVPTKCTGFTRALRESVSTSCPYSTLFTLFPVSRILLLYRVYKKQQASSKKKKAKKVEKSEFSGLTEDEIAQAIEGAALFLYFVTPSSIERQHCQQEVHFAVSRHVPLLAVHLAETTLPAGMDLTLSSLQAILRHRLR